MRWSRLRYGRQSGGSMEVGVPDWEDADLSAGVTAVLGSPTPGYYRDGFGVVHLRGYVAGTPGTLFVLPVGFRPEGTELFNASVYVTALGTVSSAVMPVSISGIQFRPGE